MKLSLFARAALILSACLVTPGLQASETLTSTEVEAALNAAYSKYKNLQEGANADYIPALAKVDPTIYGIALVTPEGKLYTAGDVESEVSIQSISKVFTMALVMDEQDPESIFNTMGVDATGQVFNSIVAVEQYKGAQMNPLVNAGAITATSMVSGDSRAEIWNKILAYYNDFAGRPLTVNAEVFKSEAATNQRNQAIASLMYAYDRIEENPAQATDIYTEQCSVNVNARDLATMAATLANGGRNPITGKQVMKNENCHEGVIEQIYGLFNGLLLADNPPMDEANRLRMDTVETNDEIQAKIKEIWPQVTTENFPELGDYAGYHLDFLKLFGFGFDNVDYDADISPVAKW